MGLSGNALIVEKKVGAVIAGAAAALVIGAGVVGVVVSDDGSSSGPSASAAAVVAPTFEANFATPSDFYDRFDYALSGGTPAQGDVPGTPGAGGVFPLNGDHNLQCQGPTTVRPVSLQGEQWTGSNWPALNFQEMFWWCAPSGDGSSGHMMTAQTTLGYNHAWFAPKPEFTAITKVCWDINETTEGGKWTEVQFVSHADAVRYPAGTHLTLPNAPVTGPVARGTGGFDLGYTEPGFRPEATGGNSSVGPNNGLQPEGGTLAGLKIEFGGIFQWFQNQDTITASSVGWPGVGLIGPPYTDKASRFTTCIENASGSQIRITNARPDGTQTFLITGQIPQDSRRVVFHDAEYDGPKRGLYDPNALTWHWDNIQVFTSSGPEVPPTTQLPPPTTSIPPTTPPSTSPPSTATTTTVPQSTTTTAPASTTTTGGTTTTVGPTTTSPFVTVPRSDLEALIAALEQLLASLQAILAGG